MEYRNLGRTSLKISPLCLGVMACGSPNRQTRGQEIRAAVDRLVPGNGIHYSKRRISIPAARAKRLWAWQ